MEMEAKRLLARRALERLKALESDCIRLMHGPNLTAGQLYRYRGKAGRAELKIRIQTDARILATKNFFSDGMSKDIDITGSVGGLDRRGPARTLWGAEPGTASAQRFAPPITRPRTYQAPSGKRTFHFAHETISGSTKEAIASVGQHDHYLQDSDKVPGLEALLAEEAQDRTDYVARDVVPADEVGPMIFSNLGAVKDFAPAWKTVAKTAIRAAGPEKKPWLKVQPDRDDPFWQSVLQRNFLPSKVREQILAGGSEWIDVEKDEIEATLAALRVCGWHERNAGQNSNGQKSRIRADQIRYYAGSSPELQRRIVGEIPKELDGAAKRRVLEEFTSEFRWRDLPFVCVFHEADENNNPLNGHFHLDYHARPMRRFSRECPPAVPQALRDAYEKSKAGYAAKGKAYPKNGKLKRQIELWEEAASNPQSEWEGMWEPDIVFHYKTDSGKKKTTHPFDRNVHADTRDDGWIFDLKKKYAEIVSEELRAVGSETQFHPGKLSEIGIDKESDVHLGPRQNWREKQGYPTLDGSDNEQRQWDHQVSELLRQHPLAMYPTDAPTQTLRFVRDAAAMLKARLTSRARHIHFHAARRITADSERLPQHPKKLSGKEFKRTYDLMEDAQEHLQCAEILFDDYGSWLPEIDAALTQSTVARVQPPVAIASANKTETIQEAPTPGCDETHPRTADSALADTAATREAARNHARTLDPNAMDGQRVTTMLERLAQQADSEPSENSEKMSPVSADIDGKLAEGLSVDPNTQSAQAPQQNSNRTQTADARMREKDEPVALPADLAGRVFQHDQSPPKTRKVSDRPKDVESASSSNKASAIPGEPADIRIGEGAPRVTSKGSPPPENSRENTPGENQLAADGLKRGFSKDTQKGSVAPTDAEPEGECGPAMPGGSGGKQTEAAIGPVANETHSKRRLEKSDALSNPVASPATSPPDAEKGIDRCEATNRREESRPAMRISQRHALLGALAEGPFLIEKLGSGYDVPAPFREKYALTDRDIADPRLQRALGIIDFDQKAELAWLAAGAISRSAELEIIDGKWRLGGSRGSDVERLLEKWSVEANVAKALHHAGQPRTPTKGAERNDTLARRREFMAIALSGHHAPTASKPNDRSRKHNLQAAIANGFGQGF